MNFLSVYVVFNAVQSTFLHSQNECRLEDKANEAFTHRLCRPRMASSPEEIRNQPCNTARATRQASSHG